MQQRPPSRNEIFLFGKISTWCAALLGIGIEIRIGIRIGIELTEIGIGIRL
jgi:hypothetical protein